MPVGRQRAACTEVLAVAHTRPVEEPTTSGDVALQRDIRLLRRSTSKSSAVKRDRRQSEPPSMEDGKDEALLQRHKQERKQLTATTTGMKKQATKKTRKNVLKRCDEMMEEMERRHKQELSQLDAGSGQISTEPPSLDPQELLQEIESEGVSEPASEPEPQVVSAQNGGLKPSKRNRQKERLARRNAKIEEVKRAAQLEAADSVDYRKIEQDSMDELITRQGLRVEEVRPDGHCLFASIQDQLAQRHGINVDVQELRQMAAAYMKSHPDDFVPFLFDEETNELRDLEDYTKELTETPMWGSDMEILALANHFDCPIAVIMAGSAPLVMNEAGAAPKLFLAFYKHSYGLGEHYNSLRDVVSGDI